MSITSSGAAAMTGAPPSTLFGWFARTLASSPDVTALDTGVQRLSYEQLDELALQRAAAIARCPIPDGSRIGLLGEGVDAYAGYLAITRLGHTVVPLSAELPPPRIAAMAQASGMAAALLGAGMPGELGRALGAGGVRLIDPAGPRARSADLDRQPGRAVPAYILFTSGSTGRPKGVPISHGQASSYLEHMLARSDLQPGMRHSQTFALTFDPSVFDLFATWGTGATLVPPRGRELLTPAGYVTSRGLTHWFSVPSLVSYARRIRDLRPGRMPGLRRSMFIGEPLTVQQAAAWQAGAPNSSIDNVYGPTELTVSCSAFRFGEQDAGDCRNGTVPIGWVHAGLSWLVVDSDGRPAQTGELLVRGAQRFDGYLDDRDNAGRFARPRPNGLVPLAVGQQPQPVDYYRTGDRVTLRDGVLVHLGRLDRQIKIDGYRIELGEIEGAIRRFPDVIDAAVLAVTAPGGEQRRLVAVVSGDWADEAELTAFLATTLPRYMVPHRILRLPELPVNASGKTDYPQLDRFAGDQLGAG